MFARSCSILAATALVALTPVVEAAVLPVLNGSFNDYSGIDPRGNFSAVNPAYWYRGPDAMVQDLVFINAPGKSSTWEGGYAVYDGFPDPPGGGYFVQADGNPLFSRLIKQNITGLTPGEEYTLGFWQAAGQQKEFIGDTTEQWKVFFGAGDIGLELLANGNFLVWAHGDQEWDSPLMTTPSGGYSPWQYVSHSFIATSANQVLTFLAWGDGGSSANLPPTVFLAGINTANNVPEPSSVVLLGTVLAALTLARRRGRGQS